MSALSKVDEKHKDLVHMSYKMRRDGLCNSIGDGKKIYVVHGVLLSVLGDLKTVQKATQLVRWRFSRPTNTTHKDSQSKIPVTRCEKCYDPRKMRFVFCVSAEAEPVLDIIIIALITSPPPPYHEGYTVKGSGVKGSDIVTGLRFPLHP